MTIYQDKLQPLEKRTKEAGETRYWLRVLAELLPDEDFGTLQQEALQLNLILQKINSTMKTEK